MKGVKGGGQAEEGRYDVRGVYTYGSDSGADYPEDEEDEEGDELVKESPDEPSFTSLDDGVEAVEMEEVITCMNER